MDIFWIKEKTKEEGITRIAIDIQTSGEDHNQHQIFGIGCFAKKGKITWNQQFCGPIPRREHFDNVYYDSFWVYQHHILAQISQSAFLSKIQSEKEMLRQFVDFYNQFENDQVEILSPKPEFDLFRLNSSLAKYNLRCPLNFSLEGKHRVTTNPISRIELLPKVFRMYYQNKANKLCFADHLPKHNAENVYHLWNESKNFQFHLGGVVGILIFLVSIICLTFQRTICSVKL